MATEFSDIYLNGTNFEELYADGGQIVEAWLNGECIWKLANKPTQIVIYLYTWYEGKFYAIGDVYTKNQYGYTVVIGTVFKGSAIENLTAHEIDKVLGLDTSEKFATRIHCDINGVWAERNGGKMFLHSGFVFDNPPDSLYKWFSDNAKLNIPQADQYGSFLSVGESLYSLNSPGNSHRTYVYESKPGYGKKEIEILETGAYMWIFDLGNNLNITFYSTMGTEHLKNYIWDDAANTDNPQYKYPIIYIRDPQNWENKKTVYFPLGNLYQEVKDSINYSGYYTIDLGGMTSYKCIGNKENIYGLIQINIYQRGFFFFWKYDGKNLYCEQTSEDKLQFCSSFTYYNVGTKFLAIRNSASGIIEGRIVKSILDTIYTKNIFSVPANIGDWEWNLSFVTDKYLYIPKSNFNLNKIRCLKVDLQTMSIEDETMEIGIREG